ncbi:hypothetical protein A3K64_04405 [Candidatus Micrarchaeota archaeon RBG_16_36_9]|nr:MAG: hypothetical protein A3K64_04405 [Candidatus Micrarchaeota archaeon RBG_16_36_9]
MTEDLRNALEEKKVILGSKRTLKYLKLGNVKKVIISSNAPESVKKDVEHYTKLTGIELETFDGTSKQLGIFCGKPFSISALAVVSK